MSFLATREVGPVKNGISIGLVYEINSVGRHDQLQVGIALSIDVNQNILFLLSNLVIIVGLSSSERLNNISRRAENCRLLLRGNGCFSFEISISFSFSRCQFGWAFPHVIGVCFESPSWFSNVNISFSVQVTSAHIQSQVSIFHGEITLRFLSGLGFEVREGILFRLESG